MEGVNEPMVLKKLTLAAIDDSVTYEEYLANCPGEGNSETNINYVQVVQGEDSTIRSESSLYAKYDKSAPNTQPYSVTNTILNYVGGETWCSAGQWIEWEFSVPEDGYYNITVKGRQNYARGSVSSRTVYIDGEIPFEEMEEISFEYENDWNNLTLADADGNPYKIYLTEGTHTIRLEATLGGSGILLEELEDSIYRLNQIYRKLLVYTGATPDQYRDYNIDQVYPEVMEAMDLESKRLYKIVDEMVAYTGQKADKIATAQTLAQQLERFVEKPNKITEEFTTFKDNITSLGTAVLNMGETKLDIDYLVITSTDTEPEKDEANFFSKMWHEIKAFAATFYVDYDAVGDVYEENDEEVVTVWILSGRDQGTILKSMVDDTFTPDTGIKVNVEVVAANALLSAVMAGSMMPVTVFAQSNDENPTEKTETVYSVLNSDGSISDTIVSSWLHDEDGINNIKETLLKVGTNEQVSGQTEYANSIIDTVKEIMNVSDRYKENLANAGLEYSEKVVNEQAKIVSNAISYFIVNQSSEIRSPINIVQDGIGQSMNAFTPLQMANYVATLANGGTRYKVSIVDKITSPDGEVIQEYTPEVLDQIDIPADVLQAIKEGMRRVNTSPSNSTNYSLFASFPIEVAGKTGTADFSTQEQYDYQGRKAYANYISFAPANNPQIAIFSTIYDGNRGANSAFVHKAIYEAYFKDELLQINPNYASTSATFQKYVVGAPADNKQGAEADKEATNEGTEDLGTTEGSSQELNIPVESGTGAD